MKYLLKAVTTNNRDLKTSILFAMEDATYLFNCPDGFQRIALNSKMKFRSVRQVFISMMHPDYFGGFPGFYLSSREATGADLQNFQLNVAAPEGIRNALHASTSFIGNLKYIQYVEYTQPKQIVNQDSTQFIHGTDKSMIYKDSLLSVTCIPLASPNQREKDCYSFIGVPTQFKGKFLPHKAKELGCDPRVHFKMLCDGLNVTLADGSIVYPYQVISDPLPSSCFILMFMPNDNYLESLFSEDTIQKFQPFFIENIDTKVQKLSIIYHSVPLSVLLNEHYKDFMRRFGPNVTHVLDCHEINNEVISRTKAYTLSARHSAVCPQIIPLSPIACKQYETLNTPMLKKHFEDIDYVHAKLGLIYNFQPQSIAGVDNSQLILNKDIFNEVEDSIRSELTLMVKNLIELKREQISTFPNQKQIEAFKDDVGEPEILFLGTISMKPTMYRNASAIMFFVNNHSILMDCAEGSYGQLWDHYQTKEKVDEVIKTMRVIFITHIHGDHQLGVLKIMLERDRLIEKVDPENKLYIVVPTIMKKWMDIFRQDSLRYPEMVELVPSNSVNPESIKYYRENETYERPDFGGVEELKEEEELKCTAEINHDEACKNKNKGEKPKNVPCPQKSYEEINDLIENFQTENELAREMFGVLSKTMGITQLLAIETDHCIESYGCLINSPAFGRILYSGDTAPCQNLMNYAQKVTLLIHEATFDNSLEKDAYLKKHTTTNQVMAIAEKCQPWRTVMTHFSPRYAKISEITDQHLATKTMVAFDHMRMKLSQFEWAYNMLEIYRKVFTDDENLDKPLCVSKMQEMPKKHMKA